MPDKAAESTSTEEFVPAHEPRQELSELVRRSAEIRERLKVIATRLSELTPPPEPPAPAE